MNLSESNAWLILLLDEPRPLRKKLVALGIIADRLAPHGIVPVLAGGTALEHYTAGESAGDEVELALIPSEIVDRVFLEFFFKKDRHRWIRADLDLVFSLHTGHPHGPLNEIEIDGLTVTILGIDDLLIERLRAWARWKSEEDGRRMRHLATLGKDSINWDYIRRKTAMNSDEQSAFEMLKHEFSTS